jgi:fused signal recognition particle receptor
MQEIIDFDVPEYTYPLVILISGVNGVGKTTACGKLAKRFRDAGKSVILAAADTFRAAAAEQLGVWAERTGARLIRHDAGADAAAVVFDALTAAKAKGTDVVIIDTAGRLHNKKNLMNELEKINRVVEREVPDADYRTYIVLDATTGQNAAAQTAAFDDIIDIDGIILTKLDGTAKGGVVFAVSSERELPILYVGVGERAEDMIEFNAGEFVKELISL